MAAAPHKQDDKEEWVRSQKRTFTKWVNNHLRKKSFSPLTPETVENEFDTGIKLGEIINALYEIPLPKFNKAPKLRPHKLDNITLALKMVDDAKVKTNFLKSNHLADHDLKMILGMLWSIILDYAIKGINVDEMTAKEGLLLWVQKKTKGYRDVAQPVNNFTQDWRNGMAFAALIHKHQPNEINYDALDAKDARKNLETAFAAAEKLGIPRLLEPEDVMVERPDERSIMTYVSEFFHRFAQQDLKEINARRIAKLVKFSRHISQRSSEYESRAQALLQWINQKVGAFGDHNFGNTLEEAQLFQDRLKAYYMTEKPPKIGEKLDIESLLAEIQTELKVNDRHPYVPDAKVAPAALDAAWDGLTAAERAYTTAVRDNRFKFIKKEETKLSAEKEAEIKESFAKFDQNKDDSLDKVEFKAACSAMSLPFKDEAAFQKTFNEVAEGKATVNFVQYARFAARLFEDRDDPNQLREAFKALADEKDTISAAQLNVPPLNEDDVKFLVSQMPDKGQGQLDYGAFIGSAFNLAQ